MKNPGFLMLIPNHTVHLRCSKPNSMDWLNLGTKTTKHGRSRVGFPFIWHQKLDASAELKL